MAPSPKKADSSPKKKVRKSCEVCRKVKCSCKKARVEESVEEPAVEEPAVEKPAVGNDELIAVLTALVTPEWQAAMIDSEGNSWLKVPFIDALLKFREGEPEETFMMKPDDNFLQDLFSLVGQDPTFALVCLGLVFDVLSPQVEQRLVMAFEEENASLDEAVAFKDAELSELINKRAACDKRVGSALEKAGCTRLGQEKGAKNKPSKQRA